MNDYGGHLEEELFSGTNFIHIEAEIQSDLWEKLKSEFTQSGWSEQEGILFTLAAGLDYIRAERLRDEIGAGADPEAQIERLLRERSYVDGQYAVMKYRAYQFLQDAKTLNWKLNACKQELEGMRQAYQSLRKQLDEK